MLSVLGLIWAVFLAGTFLHVPFCSGWLYDGLGAGSALVVVSRAVAVRSERAAWAFAGAGLLASTCGDLTWSVLSATGDPPYPNASDALYLMAYPCLYVALVLLLRDRMRRFPVSSWLDGLVTGLALTALVAAVAFGRVAASTHGSSFGIAVALAYPVCDLVLLAMVAGALALIGWRADSRWWALSAGFALVAIADTVFLFRTATGGYRAGTWLDALWPAAGLLIAVISWRPSRRLSGSGFTGWPALVPSLASTLGAIGVLWTAAGPKAPRLAVTLAALTLLAATARFGLGFREVASLAESRQEALTDELTGLANRRALLRVLGRPKGTFTCAGLLLIDLDRFKEVNDSLGHHVGDELLVQVARRLRSVVQNVTGVRGLVARLGGDEFAVLLTPGGPSAPGAAPGRAQGTAMTRDAVRLVAERIVATMEAPFVLNDVTLHMRGSVGVGLLPEHTTDPLALLQRADVAMYTAKVSSNHLGIYRPEDDPHSRERLHLQDELRQALRAGRIVCHYQPLMDLATGRAVGVEALARWNHPKRGLVLPEEFLPVAEHAGLMRELTAAVLNQALGQVRTWRDAGLDVQVAVNLSPTNLLDVDLPELIARSLREHRVPGSMLRVEITETVLMTKFERSQQILERLKALGVEASIDDYGTGYSSLSYLQELPVQELKIDRAFVSRLTQDARTVAIVRSTVELAHSLGMRLVGEGVGDPETAAVLRSVGCDLAQGFHYCRPLRGDVMLRWLTEHGRLRTADRSGAEALTAHAASGRSASQSVARGR